MKIGKMKLLITEFEDFSQEAIKMLSEKFDVYLLKVFYSGQHLAIVGDTLLRIFHVRAEEQGSI